MDNLNSIDVYSGLDTASEDNEESKVKTRTRPLQEDISLDIPNKVILKKEE